MIVRALQERSYEKNRGNYLTYESSLQSHYIHVSTYKWLRFLLVSINERTTPKKMKWCQNDVISIHSSSFLSAPRRTGFTKALGKAPTGGVNSLDWREAVWRGPEVRHFWHLKKYWTKYFRCQIIYSTLSSLSRKFSSFVYFSWIFFKIPLTWRSTIFSSFPNPV